MDRIFERVLEDIKPTEEEVAIETNQANEIVNRLRRVVPRDVEIRVVGSLAHGTNLRGASDIDVFLLFDKKKAKSTITKEGLEYARKITGKNDHIEIKYAEHPYARVYFGALNAEADIVPAYKIENIEEMATAVDRSPMHSEFILTHLTEKQKDEVRLLKQFMKAHGLYGAEVFTGGFSGYLCELLVYHASSFVGVMNLFAKASLPLLLVNGEGRIVDESRVKEIVEKFKSQFVVVDPVDPNRNVASPVSIESLAKFVALARQFIDKPSIKAFYGTGFAHDLARYKIKELMKMSGMDFFVLSVRLPDKSEDILWPQLRRVSEQIKAFVEQYGFSLPIALQTIHARTGILLFCSYRQELRSRFVKGPSVFLADAFGAFIKSHKRALGITFVKDSVFALEPNRFATVKDALRYVASGKMSKKHKDVPISGAKLYVNRIPEDYIDAVYAELLRLLKP
ncbi:MAG: CCA tRNA nucleotidyltransferase [Candidatus Micrarchaeia archaeon]